MNRQYLWVLLFCSVLAGCQTLRPSADEPPATEQDIAAREARLAAFKPWRAFGALVIDSEKDGVVNASFAWDVAEDGFQIKLFGPLGLQQYEVSEDTTGAELIADGERITGYSAEYLLRQTLGVDIPLGKMQSWAVGLPGDATEVERDRQGRLSEMIHAPGALSGGALSGTGTGAGIATEIGEEWQIKFQRYRKFEDLDLPRAIVVAGEGVEIRLNIKKWLKPDEADTGRLVIPGVSS